MEEHPIESLMQTAMYNIQDMIDVETIIGEPIDSANGTMIIPISKVCFGFAAGGSDFKDEVISEYEKEDRNETIKTKNPFGGGAGAGVKITPVGFLVVEKEEGTFPRFIPVEHTCAIDKILDYIPDLFQRIEKMFCNIKKKETKTEENETQQTEEVKVNSTKNDTKNDNKNKTEENIEKDYFKTEIPVESDGEDL